MNAFANIDFGVLVPGESGITATGGNQATAYQLRKQVTVFSTVPFGSGCVLPSAYAAGTPPIIMNRGANSLFVYPAQGDQIESLGTNFPYTCNAGDDVEFISFDPPLSRAPRQWWLITSPPGMHTSPVFNSIVAGATPFNIYGLPTGSGSINLFASSGIGASAIGGDIQIAAGDGTGASRPGNVTISAGVSSLGVPGNIALLGLTTAFQFAISSNLVTTGANSSTQSFFYASNALSGSSTAAIYAPFKIAITDSVVIKGGVINGLDVAIAPAPGMSGNRFAINARIDMSTAYNPGSSAGAGGRRIVGLQGTVSNTPNQTGRIGKIVGAGGYQGNMTAVTGGAINRKNSTAFGSVLGGEINAFLAAGSSASWRTAIKASTGGVNNVRGDYLDAALMIGEFDPTVRDDFGWEYALMIGSSLSYGPTDSDSTIIGYVPRQYAGLETPLANRGIDFQWVQFTAGGASILMPNFQVDELGTSYSNQIYTTNHIQSANGALNSITINNAGEYLFKPTFIVQAPPSGGAQASFLVATMAASRPIAFGNSGAGYTNGSTVSALGGAGASPTWTITTGAGGALTGLTQVTAGSWTIPPANPVQLTDGSNNSAWVNFLTYVSNLPTTPTFTPTSPLVLGTTFEWAANGAGYAVGNVLTIVGDTGTAAQLTVDAVTAQGGLTFTSAPVQFTANTVGGGSSTSITVTAMAFGKIVPNMIFNGTGFATNTVIKSQTSGSPGGTGEYLLYGVAQTVASSVTCTATAAIAIGAHVTTAGSLSVLTGTFNSTTGGSGTGASIQCVYGVATFTITAGNGYPAKPAPRIQSSLTAYRVADLTAVMAVTANTLSLNGLIGGGAVVVPNPTTTTATTQAATAKWVADRGSPVLIGTLIGANLNTTADQAITLDLRGNTRWFGTGNSTAIGSIILTNASGTVTTAVGGLYTAAAKGGTALVPNTQAWSTAATTGLVRTAWSTTPASTVWTVTAIYLSLTTPEGSAKTGDIYIYAYLLP